MLGTALTSDLDELSKGSNDFVDTGRKLLVHKFKRLETRPDVKNKFKVGGCVVLLDGLPPHAFCFYPNN